MGDRAIDLDAAATLFAGSDLEREVARMPVIDRPWRYFDAAGDAVRSACERLGARQEGAFLVQQGTRFGMPDMAALYATALCRAGARIE